MTTKRINLILIILGLFNSTIAQIVKERTEKLFLAPKILLEKNTEFYNSKGQLVQLISDDCRSEMKTTVTTYIYNDKSQLSQELFIGIYSYQDSTKTKLLTDTSIISNTFYFYDSSGLLKLEKEYNFQCHHDTCNIIEYFYKGKLLQKKFCMQTCSMRKLNYNYPIYYKYDKNDSLILEQAWGPTDTTKIWYAYSYNYDLLPDKFIYERFYSRDDSLQLEERRVSRTEYLKDGRKSRTFFIEKDSSYDHFEYYKNDLLKAQNSVRNGRQTWKQVSYYDKRKNVRKLETYTNNEGKDSKLKLYYYQTFDYKYY